MNRLVFIGNGFDLAHGLKTSYADFINWYKVHRIVELGKIHTNVSSDSLCSIQLKERQALSIYAMNYMMGHQLDFSHESFWDYILHNNYDFDVKFSTFFERILKGLESKTWAGIEQDYYELLTQYAFPVSITNKEPDIKLIAGLNEQLHYLQELLVEYLNEITAEKPKKIQSIEDAIYAPINTKDIAVASRKFMKEHVEYWLNGGYEKLPYIKDCYGIVPFGHLDDVAEYKRRPTPESVNEDYPLLLRLPNQIMLVNFNYTPTAKKYWNSAIASLNHIHGNLDDSKSIIFGYGDELHSDFEKFKEQGNDECMRNVKSMRYLEAPNYRQILSFIESEPFQVLIMGHSCGLSDRTLLNTIFEHPNCASIKPYYYKKEDGSDNYLEMVQSISRNCKDMKLMRDRVVNKTQCEPLGQMNKTN